MTATKRRSRPELEAAQLSRKKAEAEAEAQRARNWQILSGQARGIADIAWRLADDLPGLSLVNPEVRQNCLELLDEAVPALHRLQRELRRLARITVTDGAKCRHCDGPMPPSSGARLYCSRSCRQRAYEARREATA